MTRTATALAVVAALMGAAGAIWAAAAWLPLPVLAAIAALCAAGTLAFMVAALLLLTDPQDRPDQWGRQ